MTGIRAELVFDRPQGCPVAAASAESGGTATDVTWTAATDGTVREQFTVDTGSVETADRLFDYGGSQVYEFEESADRDCLCERIEATIGPIAETYAEDGDLHVTVHTDDVEQLRAFIADLPATASVSVDSLVRGREDGEEPLVLADLGALTSRQREVLETARAMGYFDYPRTSNAGEVADELGIGTSTFTEHLNAAQSKLLAELFDADTR